MAPWLIEGLTATISGVVTVFAVLILIALIIGSLQYLIKPQKMVDALKGIFKSSKAKDYKKQTVNEMAADEVAGKTTIAAVEEATALEDELELVAVITAAIATSLDVSTDSLRVRSIKRVHKRSHWYRR